MEQLDSRKYDYNEYKGNDCSKIMPKEGILGSLNAEYPINVFTEFGNLKACFVGYMSDTSCIPSDTSCYPGHDVKFGPYPKEIIEKNKEIQHDLVIKLQSKGIHVVRPGEVDFSKKKSVQGYEFIRFSAFNPRDLNFYYHDSIYEFPSFQVSRQYDNELFNYINYQHREMGSKWFKSYTGLYPLYEKFRKDQGYTGDEKIDPNFPYCDAANLVRLGLDILYLVSESGNMLSYYMFRKFLEKRYNGKVRVHPMIDVYDGVHVDTTFSAIGFNKKLGKYIATVIRKRSNPLTIPAIFRGKNWVLLEGCELEHFDCIEGYAICTPEELGMNFLIVNSETIIIEERQKKMIQYFSHYGIECITHSNPYGRESGGGFHCMTNDYYREESVDYKSILETTDDSKLSKLDLAGLFDPDLLEELTNSGVDIIDWDKYCNEKGIFANYLTDHLTEEEAQKMKKRHDDLIFNTISKSS